MIYWFTGKIGAGKTIQANKLKDFLQTEKRNWRKDVFQIDDVDFENIDESIALIKAQDIAKYLNSKGCDVVVSIKSSSREKRENFKKELKSGLVEIYIHNNKKKNKEENLNYIYEEPLENFFDLDTTSENTIQTFNKLIHFLKNNGSI